MTLEIKIEFRPLIPARRDTTTAIATALRTLKATPKDEQGNPGSFVVPVKHRAACFAAAKDVGVEIKTRTEVAVDGAYARVTLK